MKAKKLSREKSGCNEMERATREWREVIDERAIVTKKGKRTKCGVERLGE